MDIIATEQASATAGREGQARSKDGKIDLKLSPPGSGGDGTNPEQLFAAGYASCFGQAIKSVAKTQGVSIDADALEVDATVSLGKAEDGFTLEVTLDAHIKGASDDDAKVLVEKAHDICPYSRATRGNIQVRLKSAGKDI